MSMTEQDIRRFCKGYDETFRRGKQYYLSDRVTITEVGNEDLDEPNDSLLTTLHAKVKGSTLLPYIVDVTIDDDTGELVDADCDCPAYFQYDGICKHIVATLLEYVNAVPYEPTSVRTAPLVKAIISNYTKQTVNDTLTFQEEEKVRIKPRLILTKGMAEVDFKLGTSRSYIIKDIYKFALTVQKCEQAEYGKALSFVHSIRAFHEDSVPLVKFILAKTAEEDVMESAYATPYFFHKENYRTLTLTPTNLDTFFDLLCGETIDLQAENDSSHTVTLLRQNPELTVTVAKRGADGAILTMNKILLLLGIRNCYVYKPEGSILFQCDEAFTKAMQEFLQVFAEADDRNMTIGKADIPAFCATVLPAISPYVKIESQGLDLQALVPPPIRIQIYLDCPERNRITCLPKIAYGSYEFSAIDRVVKPGIYRDTAAEYRLTKTLDKYFAAQDTQHHSLIITNDDEAIYRLLETGVSELMELGDVYASEKFKRLSIAPTPKISVGVSLQSDLLKLDIDSTIPDFAELTALLHSYKLRKKYHRLKNGDFVQIEDNSLSVISELADGLHLSGKDLQSKSITLPKQRALYLDGILHSNEGVSFHRDNKFKSLIRNMKAVEDSDFEVPDSLQTVLRPYQKTGFRWLKTMDTYGFGGILADDMGLGKTLQVIALFVSQKESNPQPSLVVCPASLVYNWESEIRRFAPQLTVAVVAGSAAVRKDILKSNSNYDVLVTSYDLLKRDVETYVPLKFKYQILDEAQFIKNHSTQSAKAVKQINSDSRFALTGTPIQNRLSELWSIFDFLMPDFLYSYSKFKKDMETPIVRNQDEIAQQRLHRMIAPFILRRLKSDVLKELPDKLENSIYAHMEGEQKKLYAANVKRLKDSIGKQSKNEFNTGKIQILAELTRLRQICCDPQLCYENYTHGSAKLETCMELLQNAINGGHKVLLFSQFTSMLEILQKRLDQEGIGYYCLTGATSKEKRIDLVSDFNKNDVPVFLISLKAGGTGLNLTAADIVIHYDPWWNIAAQNQATDRAHRIGQKNVVNVYKLIAKDSIEEKIMEMQETKRDLADSILSEGNVSITSLSQEELLEILK